MSDWRIPLSRLDYGLEEEAAVLRVLRRQWLTMGPEVERFEQAFARLTGTRYAIAVSNATAALHLCLMAAGVGRGDEVVQPALNFVAAANMTRLLGAEPVFADVVGLSEPTISPADVERCLTDRTRAVVVMHYAGYPCRMAEILAICRPRGIDIIEDAAHAPLARYIGPDGQEPHGRLAGDLGEIAAFSFYGNKNLVTGEGGMITTQARELAEAVRRARSHGMTSVTMDRYRGLALSYDVSHVGCNYRPTEIMAALGSVQLAKLAQNNSRRRELTALYRQVLAETAPEILVPFATQRSEPACHILAVVLPVGCDRDAVAAAMRTQGIQISIHYPPIHRMSAYRSYAHCEVPQTEEYCQREITLPLFPGMNSEDVTSVCEALAGALHV